jgi:hypothetical protein
MVALAKLSLRLDDAVADLLRKMGKAKVSTFEGWRIKGMPKR